MIEHWGKFAGWLSLAGLAFYDGFVLLGCLLLVVLLHGKQVSEYLGVKTDGNNRTGL